MNPKADSKLMVAYNSRCGDLVAIGQTNTHIDLLPYRGGYETLDEQTAGTQFRYATVST